jgi:magnesium transporter
MANKSVKRQSRKAGLPPGSLVHIGEQKTETVRITVFHFDENRYEEKEVDRIEKALPPQDQTGVTWIDVNGLHQVDVIETLGQHFKLHPLLLEDILNTNQRPKMEDYDDYLFVVLRMIYPNGQGEFVNEQVSLVVGGNYVLSFQEKEGDVFNPIRDRIRSNKGKLRKSGPDYLAYGLIDAIVDGYFVIMEKYGEEIEVLEEEVTASPSPDTLRTIHRIKRVMIQLRRSLWPLREVIGSLERGESEIIKPTTLLYFRDIYDHTIQVIDNIESFRDMLTGLLDIYLSSIANRTNEVMKVLTIIATIFIPLTFIVGIYGMNFEDMPELHWRWAYPAVWLIMIVITICLLFFFRRKKWI